MANVLTMAKIESILSLHAQGWPQRRIARALGMDRETVRKYILQRSPEAKRAKAPTGSAAKKKSKPNPADPTEGPVETCQS